MLTDEQLTDVVRAELACELSAITSSPQLLANVRRRQARRSVRAATVVGVAAVAAAVAVAVSLTDDGRPAGPSKSARGRYVSLSGPSVSLAGYETNLPAGYTFTEAATGTSCSNFFVPLGIMPSPGTPPPSQSFSALTLQASAVSGCLSVGISGNDTQGTGKDSIAPAGSQSLAIGLYQASVYQATNSPTLALYVQISTIGGGHHDLIVAAQGITQPDLVAMLQKALPTQVTPAPASDIPLVEPSSTSIAS